MKKLLSSLTLYTFLLTLGSDIVFAALPEDPLAPVTSPVTTSSTSTSSPTATTPTSLTTSTGSDPIINPEVAEPVAPEEEAPLAPDANAVNPENNENEAINEEDEPGRDPGGEEEDDPRPADTRPKQTSYDFLKNFTGNFETDLFTGAATFRYPLWVPEGRLGMTPTVSLSYSTNDGKFDSFAGYGWSFPTNAIYRSTRHGSDKLFTRNDFTADINGNTQELISIDSDAGIYGAKVETGFTKYEFSQNQWVATDTRGTRYIFGTSEAARQADPDNDARVYKWLLERVEDQNGNFIAYTYFHDAGQVYPATIRYTGHGEEPGIFEVRFVRKDRPTLTSYERGFRAETKFITDKVDIFFYQNGNPIEVMSYRLTHEARNNAVLHLRQIQVHVARDNAAVMPPIAFTYYDGTENEPMKKNNFLKEITFPYGAKQTFFYKPSTTYRLEGGEMANRLPFNVFTLHESRLVPIPNGAAQTTRYSYEGGHYYFDMLDAYKKEYAGFHIVTVTDPVGNVQKMYFHQSEFSPDNEVSVEQGEFEDHISKKGRIYREEQYDNAEHLFQKTIRTWDKLLLDEDAEDGERFFVSLRQEVLADYDGDDDSKSRASSYQYDDYGNVLQTLSLGEVTLLNERGDVQDIGQDRTESVTDYALNEDFHIVAFPSHAIKRDFFANTVGEERVFYDSLGLGQITRGNETQRDTKILSDEGDPMLAWSTTRKEYNAYGLPTRMVNPRGFATQIMYDQWNLYPTAVTNPRGHITQSTYDLVFGIPTLITDPNGARQVTNIDGLGRVRSKLISRPDGGGGDITTTSYIYQLANYPRSIRTTRHFFPAAFLVDQFSYLDGLGREIQTRAKMEDANQYSVVNKFYDARGNLSKETLPIFGAGIAFTPQNINAVGNTFAYDALSRPVSATNPLGVTRTSYDQWTQVVTDPNDNRKDFVFDAFERLTEVREYLNDQPFSTRYAYNANDNLIQIIDAKNEVKHFTYDLQGRKTREEELHPVFDLTFGVWEYAYDKNGNIISAIRPDEEETRFTYDELDRLLTENWVHEENEEDPLEATYVYDMGMNGIGRLSSVDFLGGDKDFIYDRLGRISQQELGIEIDEEVENFALSFTYDIQGNILTTTYPNNVVARNAYNNGGLLESVFVREQAAQERPIITGTKYIPTGFVGTRDFANGISTNNTYNINQMYRLTMRTSRRANDGAYLQRLTYTYDPAGNISRIIDSSATNTAKTANYLYDDLYRLTRATITNAANNQNYVHNFGYDIVGNILTFDPLNAPYEYDGASALAIMNFTSPHAVTQIGAQEFSYDRNGNMTEHATPEGDWTHSWDWRDRLVSSVFAGENEEDDSETFYSYDEAKQRILKRSIANDERVAYIEKYFDVETAGESETEKSYVFAADTKVATLETTHVGEEDPVSRLIFHHEDHLTGANVDTSENGQVLQLVDYYPYGENRVEENAEGYENDYQFTGKERDEETGLSYYEARYYDSSMGRFISRDTWEGDLKDPQSLNKYSYVRNNPLKYNDPSGESFQTALQGLASPFVYAYHHPLQTAGMVAGTVAAAAVAPVAVAVAGAALGGYAIGSATYNAITAPDADTRDYYIGQGLSATALTALLLKGASRINGSSVENLSKNHGKLTSPDFISTPKGDTVAVPDGALGPTNPRSGTGMIYKGGSGGKGMDSRTTGVRIMDADARQGDHVNYMNKTGQTIDPKAGGTIPNKDVRGHIPINNSKPKSKR